MTWTDIITWVSAVITIISMFIAIRKARMAWNAATKAEEMRDDIANLNSHGELSGLNGMLAAAIRAMEKYGPGSKPKSRLSCSPDTDVATVRALTTEMAKLRHLLVERFGDEANTLISRFKTLLVKFAEATSNKEQDKICGDIYNDLTEFSGNIKKELDQNTYGKGLVMPLVMADRRHLSK
jgi:hypothetical protein